jgi:hypothetical protein
MRDSLWKGALSAAVISLALGGAAVAAQDKGGKDPIEGLWDVTVTISQCETNQVLGTGRAIALFSEGGSLTAIPNNFYHSAQLGRWSHNRGQSYSAATWVFLFNPDGSFAGSQEVTADVDLSTNANEYTVTGTTQIFDTSDQLISTDCVTAAATRLLK